jgi:hypothetical protein
MATYQDYARDLLLAGETELPPRKNYRKFTRRGGGFYFVENRGSIRIGLTKRSSLPVTGRRKRLLLALLIAMQKEEAASKPPIRRSCGWKYALERLKKGRGA